MANLSLRGLDSSTLSRIKSNARRRGISVNRLIVETLRQQYANADQTFDDLDQLAGTWSRTEAVAFAESVTPLAEIDPGLWTSEPKAAYRVKLTAGRKGRT